MTQSIVNANIDLSCSIAKSNRNQVLISRLSLDQPSFTENYR